MTVIEENINFKDMKWISLRKHQLRRDQLDKYLSIDKCQFCIDTPGYWTII
jgi:hypothetical protein